MSFQEKNRYPLIFIALVLFLITANVGLFYRMVRIQDDVQTLYDVISNYPSNDSENKLLEIGSQAPPFTKTSIDNKQIDSTKFEGARLLLIFASSGCPACQNMFPNLEVFLNVHKTLNVLMFLDGTETEIDQIILNYGFDFPIVQLDDEMKQSYKVFGVPLSYFIDENGYILNASFASTVEHFESIVSDSQ